MVGKISLQHVNRFLLCGVLICVILYFARSILIPITFATFFAMLFTPLCRRMERHIHRGFAGLICLLIIVVAVLGIGTLVFVQSKHLARKSDQIEKRSAELLGHAQDYVSDRLNVPEEKQNAVIKKRIEEVKHSSGRVMKQFVTGFFGTLAMFVMVLIFTFLFLFQRDKYETFFIQISGGDTRPDEARKLVLEISTVAQNYLTGRLMSISIFTILFSTGYLIVGLEGAFLFAFVGALLTLIPYVGSITGGLFPLTVAFVTEGTDLALAVLAVNLCVNALDNYLIEPNVVGGQVKISAFFTILILIIGGTLWGLAGMVLFLPLLGVTKIIFDAVPELKPYGYLIGDQSQSKPADAILKKFRKIFGRKSK